MIGPIPSRFGLDEAGATASTHPSTKGELTDFSGTLICTWRLSMNLRTISRLKYMLVSGVDSPQVRSSTGGNGRYANDTTLAEQEDFSKLVPDGMPLIRPSKVDVYSILKKLQEGPARKDEKMRLMSLRDAAARETLDAMQLVSQP
jgi:hypothetical protein